MVEFIGGSRKLLQALWKTFPNGEYYWIYELKKKIYLIAKLNFAMVPPDSYFYDKNKLSGELLIDPFGI